MSSPAILFKLQELPAVRPWGKERQKRLSWFGLSDGCYCIDTGAGRLFEYLGPPRPGFDQPWCNYQVARLFEDIIEIWPSVSEPVPDDIAKFFPAWFAKKFGGREKEIDLFDALDAWQAHMHGIYLGAKLPLSEAIEGLCDWPNQRRLDGFYLASKPRIFFWRIGSEFHLACDSQAPWTPQRVRMKCPFEAAQHAVAEFFREFLREMGLRVDDIIRNGWHGEPCTIDLARLSAEQAEREDWAKNALATVRATDWEAMRDVIFDS